jgi:predicted ArsR family transcriptional regulator
MTAAIRDEIIAYLITNRSASVSELASALDVTRADVRYHIKLLLTKQLIEIAPEPLAKKNRGRGRPGASFQLTNKSLPDNYQVLAATLLRHYLHERHRSIEETVESLAALIFSDFPEIKGASTQQMNQVVNELNKHHYHAHWEARRDGPAFIFENCPYAAILADFPFLCEMDRQFLIKCIHLPVTLQQRIKSSSRKPPACVLEINISKKIAP